MNMPLLDIQPRALKFPVDLQKQTSCVIQLTNTTLQYVAFKVKTTSPKKYCVRPNIGVVPPKSSCEFTVIMQAFKEPPADMVCKDKFLIQSATVSAETTEDDITASMFSKGEGKHVEENKLRVILVPPSDSPEVSPVKKTLTQEAVTEGSNMDRLYNQSETVTPPSYESEITKDPTAFGHDEFMAVEGVKEFKKPSRGIGNFAEDFFTSNVMNATKGGHDTLKEEEESESDLIRSHKDADDGRGIKSTNNLDAPMKKAMDLPRDTNGITSANSVADSYEQKKTNTQNINAMDKNKLVKDIEEMKLKINALESNLKQADSTISKLLEDRSISSDHRLSLQEELEEMKRKKIVKEVHIGFPLLYLCIVAFISVIIGYCLRT